MREEQDTINDTDYRISTITGTLLDLRDQDGDGRIEEITRLRQEILNGVMMHNDIRDPKMLGALDKLMTGISNSEFRKKTLKQDDDNTKADLLLRRAMVLCQSRQSNGGDTTPPPIDGPREEAFLELELTSKDINVSPGVLIIGDDIQATADMRGTVE